MRLRYTRNYNPFIHESNFYVSEGTIDVLESNESGEEHVVGRIAFDMIDYSRVLSEEIASLEDVCDADSEGWMNIYENLINPGTGEAYPATGCTEVFEHITFAYRIELLPVAKRLESYILYHVAHITGASTIFVMFEDSSELSKEALSRMGFRKLGDSDYLVLPTAIRFEIPIITEKESFLELEPSTDYTLHLESIWNKEVILEILNPVSDE